MHPKIDADQHLSPPFTITGPVDDGKGGYDDDLAMAITFVITQDQGDDQVAKGVGKSNKVYTRGGSDQKWHGEVVMADGTQFQPGTAVVSAFAALVNDDGEWELYPWGRTVNLVNP
jgi:hypothetical protein